MDFEKIRQLCSERNISIIDLEQKLGLGNGSICYWAKEGVHPRINNVRAVAEFFGVAIEELLKKEEKKEGEQ